MMLKHGSAVIALGLLWACSEAPVAPDFEPAFARPGSGVQYEITDWQGGVWSDGGGPINAGIGADGSFSFDAGGKAKKAPPEICVDLSSVVAIHDQANYDELVGLVASDANSNGMAAVCSDASVHTRDHSNSTDMPVGAIEHAGGKIVLEDYGVTSGVSWEWRLQFDVEGPLSHLPERGKGICIHHAAATTWHVYNDDDLAVDPPAGCEAAGSTIDNIMRLTRFGGEDMILVAEFRVPFRFSFVEK